MYFMRISDPRQWSDDSFKKEKKPVDVQNRHATLEKLYNIAEPITFQSLSLL